MIDTLASSLFSLAYVEVPYRRSIFETNQESRKISEKCVLLLLRKCAFPSHRGDVPKIGTRSPLGSNFPAVNIS